MIFKNSKWIWAKGKPYANQFVRFEDKFTYNGEGKVTLKLAAESDYIVYLGGKRLCFCQFAGYINEKYYDAEDITDYCVKGENLISFTVRYEGCNSSCHIDCGPGLIYSVEIDGDEVAYSSTATGSALDTSYIQGVTRSVTPQLGTAVDMCGTKAPLSLDNSVERELPYVFLPRPVKRCDTLERVKATRLNLNDREIYDLGREEAGYLYLRVRCNAPTTVKVAYGEHIENGYVEYLIGPRNFSLDFECPAGESEFENLFLRVAGRYFEVVDGNGVEVLEIGLIPFLYPLTEKSIELSGIDKEIYEVSRRTLRLCMHTHYEDCPWREQSFYVLDARNQMLCGYYAFEETEFQRENLIFASKGLREDGMLELTYPAINTPAIPFFSAMYPVAVFEYVEHTNDTSIIPIVMPTMKSIMARIYSWIDDTGLITNPPKPYWNFYEWSYGNEGRKGFGDGGTHDLIINCAFIYSVERLNKLAELVGEAPLQYDVDKIKEAVIREFFNKDTGVFNNCMENDSKGVLGNAFAILVGLGDERTLGAILNADEHGLTPPTLSMKGYVYDAILKYDSSAKDLVLDHIRRTYKKMLDAGATSFWETELGYVDFHYAGSLCHGWSAMPIYYYNKLL